MATYNLDNSKVAIRGLDYSDAHDVRNAVHAVLREEFERVLQDPAIAARIREAARVDNDLPLSLRLNIQPEDVPDP